MRPYPQHPQDPGPSSPYRKISVASLQSDFDGDDDDGSSQGGEKLSGRDKPRIHLACQNCRVKRTRCPGERPVCSSCAKAGVVCEWPSGRRRKRTRKEMEEARRVEREEKQAEENKRLKGDGMQGFQQFPPQQQTVPLGFDDYASMLSFNLGWTDLFGAGQTQPQLAPPSQMPGQLNPNPSVPIESSMYTDQGAYVWPSNFTDPFAPTGVTQPQAPDQPGSMLNPYPPPQSVSAPQMATPGWVNTTPATDQRIIDALERQAAYIEGEPGEDDLELFYYRFSGTTAIRPGINRISLKLQRRPRLSATPSSVAQTGLLPAPTSDLSANPAPSPDQLPTDLWDSQSLPLPHVWKPLFENFFTFMCQYFPSLQRRRMMERWETNTMSAFLANCICALGARFSHISVTSTPGPPTSEGTAHAAPFIAKAQELVIPLLHLPAHDVCTGLLFLSWASYGQNSESGLWQFGGMAFRMAIDLGMHENSDIYESESHQVRTRLLFWSLFITDRVVAFATGRPATIPEDIIEIPLPTDDDLYPDPARNTAEYGEPTSPPEPSPFVQLVKLTIICGRISDVLNGRRGKPRTLVKEPEPLIERLKELQMRLVQFVGGLPPSLQWSAENFKHHNKRGHGGIFLSLHLWSNAVLALVYHPQLLSSPSGYETPLNQSMSRSMSLSLASSRQICECMVFADLVSSSAYLSNPFIVQPLYVAAMALILEMRSGQATGQGQGHTDALVISMTRQNFSAILNAVCRMEQYWAGVGGVATLLEQRSGITPAPRRRINTFISLPDEGLLRRFTASRHHPANVAPATETSLRDSIARRSSGEDHPTGHSGGSLGLLGGTGRSPVDIAKLMAGYTVEGMSFEPADRVDLERLLGIAHT